MIFVNNAYISTFQDIMCVKCNSIASIYYLLNKFTEALLGDKYCNTSRAGTEDSVLALQPFRMKFNLHIWVLHV